MTLAAATCEMHLCVLCVWWSKMGEGEGRGVEGRSGPWGGLRQCRNRRSVGKFDLSFVSNWS